MTQEVETMCAVEFRNEISGEQIVVGLGPPVYDEIKDWYRCSTKISWSDGEAVGFVYGDDPFQAICLSLEKFRVFFEKRGEDFRTLRQNAPHMHFPKQIPWVYGSDVYDRLCRMVDDEVQKIENERTRRYAAQKQGRGDEPPEDDDVPR